jgi:S-adenosylmethionine synthetase
MSIEAAAGKNPVSHVGKIYNVVARQIAESLVAGSHEIVKAECLLVSKIGAPVTDPALIHVRLAAADRFRAADFERFASEVAADRLGRIPELIEKFVAGRVEVY